MVGTENARAKLREWLPVAAIVLVVLRVLFGPNAGDPAVLAAVVIVVVGALFALPALNVHVLPFVLSRLTAVGLRKDVYGEIFIEADADAVWDVFEPRPRPDSFHMHVARIDAVPAGEDGRPRIALVMDAKAIGFDKRYTAAVETVEPGRFTRLHYLDPVPEVSGMRTLFAEYEIHPTESGTWVRYYERVDHRNAMSRFYLNVVPPGPDLLRSLKARVEGRHDDSLAGVVEAAQQRGEDVNAAYTRAPHVHHLKRVLPVAALALALYVPALIWAIPTLFATL